MPHREEEITLLRRELELLMGERQLLLQIAGAAASLIASMDTKDLPVAAVEAADMVATTLNSLTEESFQDALASIHAEIDSDTSAPISA